MKGVGKLTSFLGGPLGVAMVAGMIGFTIWQSKMEAQKRKMDDLKTGLSQIGFEYATTGLLSKDRARDLLTENKETLNLVNNLGQYGLKLGTVAEAVTGNKAAYGQVVGSMKAREDALKGWLALPKGVPGMGFGKFTQGGKLKDSDEFGLHPLAALKQLNVTPGKESFWHSEKEATNLKVKDLIKDSEDARKSFEDLYGKEIKIQEALDNIQKARIEGVAEKFGINLAKASAATDMLMTNLATMSAPEATFSSRIEAMSSNVGNLTTSFLAVNSAQAAFFAAQRELPKAFKSGEGKDAKKIPAKIDPITGMFNVADEQGAAQNAAITGMAEATGKTVIDTYTQIALAGENTAEAQATAGLVATASFMKQRDAAVASLTPLVGSKKAAQDLVDTYFALPSEIALNVNAQGAENTIATLQKMGYTIATLPQGRVRIVANTEAEANKLKGFGGVIKNIPGTKRFTVTFPSAAEAQAALDHIMPKPKPIVVPFYHPMMGMPSGPAGTEKPKGVKVENQTTTTVSVQMDGSVSAAEAALNALESARTAPISVTDNGSADAVEQKIASATHDRTVSVFMHMVGGIPQVPDQNVNIFQHNIPPMIAAPTSPVNRWGGIDHFGKGGIHAKVGRGDLVHWAEPETGGEAYIPRKGDADRSKAILAEAAGWYGMGLHKMAAGGVIGSTNAPLGDFLSRFMSAPSGWLTERTTAMTAQRDAVFAVKDAEKALSDVRKDAKHTALQLAQAQATLADSRRSLATANIQLAKAKLAPRDQFKASLDMGVRNTSSFIANLNALSAKGYGALAMQLLQMGGPEAEAIAAGAKNWSASTASRVNAQVQTAQAQQKTLENMPAMLAIRSAVAQGKSYSTLLGTGEFTGQDINAALALMETELNKTATGRAMLASMRGDTAAALGGAIRGFAAGGIAGPGTMYRFAEPSSGGEAVIPRFGPNATALLSKAASWHGKSVSDLGSRVSQAARPVQVHISVTGEGQMASMIEARVDGKLVQVAQAVTRGRNVRS
jgi:hypothetical protein